MRVFNKKAVTSRFTPCALNLMMSAASIAIISPCAVTTTHAAEIAMDASQSAETTLKQFQQILPSQIKANPYLEFHKIELGKMDKSGNMILSGFNLGSQTDHIYYILYLLDRKLDVKGWVKNTYSSSQVQKLTDFQKLALTEDGDLIKTMSKEIIETYYHIKDFITQSRSDDETIELANQVKSMLTFHDFLIWTQAYRDVISFEKKKCNDKYNEKAKKLTNELEDVKTKAQLKVYDINEEYDIKILNIDGVIEGAKKTLQSQTDPKRKLDNQKSLTSSKLKRSEIENERKNKIENIQNDVNKLEKDNEEALKVLTDANNDVIRALEDKFKKILEEKGTKYYKKFVRVLWNRTSSNRTEFPYYNDFDKYLISHPAIFTNAVNVVNDQLLNNFGEGKEDDKWIFKNFLKISDNVIEEDSDNVIEEDIVELPMPSTYVANQQESKVSEDQQQEGALNEMLQEENVQEQAQTDEQPQEQSEAPVEVSNATTITTTTTSLSPTPKERAAEREAAEEQKRIALEQRKAEQRKATAIEDEKWVKAHALEEEKKKAAQALLDAQKLSEGYNEKKKIESSIQGVSATVLVSEVKPSVSYAQSLAVQPTVQARREQRDSRQVPLGAQTRAPQGQPTNNEVQKKNNLTTSPAFVPRGNGRGTGNTSHRPNVKR